MNTKWIETPYLQFKEHTEDPLFEHEILWADGGVTGRNPSKIGGPFAWIRTFQDHPIAMNAGLITPGENKTETVSNNHTEFVAILSGLQHLPFDWYGYLCSDSQITLGRFFLSWKLKNIPQWMSDMYLEQRHRLIYWDKITPVLLSGHPTKAELASGIGARIYPCSKWNVQVDQRCKELAIKQLKGGI